MNPVAKISDFRSGSGSSREALHQSSAVDPQSQLSNLNSVKERGSNGALRSQLQGNLGVALLTGGGDKPYALGMAAALTSVGIRVDFIGSDDLSVPELLANSRLNFLNLRGDQREDASTKAKVLRVLKYYARLIGYAVKAKAKLL